MFICIALISLSIPAIPVLRLSTICFLEAISTVFFISSASSVCFPASSSSISAFCASSSLSLVAALTSRSLITGNCFSFSSQGFNISSSSVTFSFSLKASLYISSSDLAFWLSKIAISSLFSYSDIFDCMCSIDVLIKAILFAFCLTVSALATNGNNSSHSDCTLSI